MKPLTKRIILFSAVALAGLAVIGVVVAAAVYPTKAPYRSALAQYRVVYDANVRLITNSSSLNASGASDAQFLAGIETAQASVTRLETETEVLGSEEVLQDGEGKRLYDEFAAAVEDYTKYSMDALASMSVVRPVIVECSAKMGALTEDNTAAQAMQSCADEFDALARVDDRDYQTLVAAFRVEYQALADILKERGELPTTGDPNSASRTQLEADQETAIEALSLTSQEFSRNVQASRQRVDITASAQALDQYLSRGASLFGF